MNIKLGYQIYSAREDAEKDLGAVCAQLKEMGYDGVEFAGFYGNTAEQVNEILKKTGLAAVSSHVPYQSIVEDMAGTIAFHKAIGCKFIAVPYLDEATRPGAEGFAAAIRNIYKFGQMCKAEGIQLLYHNHDFEFAKMPDGQYALDYMYDAIPADLLQTELDICWVKVAGEEPVDYIKKYAGRAPVVHLKDFYKEGKPANMYELIGIETEKKEETGKFEFRPVGHGMQDIPPVLDAALEAGSKWVVVEQDQSYDTPALEAVKMSRDYLKGLGW